MKTERQESTVQASSSPLTKIEQNIGKMPSSIENYDFPNQIRVMTQRIGKRTVDYSLGIAKSTVSVRTSGKLSLAEQEAQSSNRMRQHKEMMSPINRQLSRIDQIKTAVEANAQTTVNVEAFKKQSSFRESMPQVGLSQGLTQPKTA